MIVRRIHENEIKRVHEFYALAFEYGMENSQLTPEEYYRRTVAEPHSRQDIHWDCQWAAFANDDQTMLSTMITIPYRVNYDGRNVGMMGVGGVSTLPQYRRHGGIRACFEQALPYMYDQGAAFSYLYPFSTSYYRKFGYELGCQRHLYRLRLAGMPRCDAPGRCLLLEPGVNLKADIAQIDHAWQQRYNLMTLDENVEYQWVGRANPFRDQEYTYVYRGAAEEPKGYMTFKLQLEGRERNLLCTRFCFVDLEGFWGLMKLLVSTAADHPYVLLRLPADIPLEPLLPEWRFDTVHCTQELYGMVRVVDVAQVLRMSHARGSGSLTLAVSDDQIPQNNGCFHVSFENGLVTSVGSTGERPDLSMDIQAFSTLIVGRHDAEAIPYFPNVTMACPLEKAAQLFYRKPLYITRSF